MNYPNSPGKYFPTLDYSNFHFSEKKKNVCKKRLTVLHFSEKNQWKIKIL